MDYIYAFSRACFINLLPSEPGLKPRSKPRFVAGLKALRPCFHRKTPEKYLWSKPETQG